MIDFPNVESLRILQDEFKIDTYVVERDVIEFVGLLRKFFL